MVTYDTLGHGRGVVIGPDNVRVMRLARAAPAGAENWVGRVRDFADVIRLQENPVTPLPSGEYAGLIRPFLGAEAFVNLLHCFTGEPYTIRRTGDNVPSIAGQIDAALPGGVTVSGIAGCGIVQFGGTWVDADGDNFVDPGAEANSLSGQVPIPGVGGNWVFVD